jgi:sulfatase maturation enzyme AslB (radical SAM superfamily)
VQTNGTILNNKIKQLLSRGNFRIGISIDSFQKETYELVRKNSSFEKVLKNISFFADHASRNKYNLGISVCPMQQNWKELPEIILKSNEFKAIVYFNTVLSPYNCSLSSLTFSELSGIIEKLSSFKLPTRNKIERKNKIHFENFLNQLHFWCEDKRSWQNLNIQGIIQLFVVKFEKYLLQNPQEPHKTISFYQEKLTNFITRFEDTELFRYALKKSIETPTEIIVNDLNNRDVDDLCALYKTNMKKLEAGTKQCNE